jgi:hypothetical protein
MNNELNNSSETKNEITLLEKYKVYFNYKFEGINITELGRKHGLKQYQIIKIISECSSELSNGPKLSIGTKDIPYYTEKEILKESTVYTYKKLSKDEKKIYKLTAKNGCKKKD